MAEIIIDIDERGNVRVEGKDISGPDCKALTKEIEDAIGVVEKVELKPEYRRARTVLRKTSA